MVYVKMVNRKQIWCSSCRDHLKIYDILGNDTLFRLRSHGSGRTFDRLKFSPQTFFCSHGSVHYFRPIHTELWTVRVLNFRMVKVIPCETRERSIGQKFVRCLVNVALRWCYTRRFATTIFSATQHYNIVANGCNIVPTVLRYVALKIVVANRLL